MCRRNSARTKPCLNMCREHRIYCLVLTGKSAKIVALGGRAAVEEKMDAYLADIANKQAKTDSGRALYADARGTHTRVSQ